MRHRIPLALAIVLLSVDLVVAAPPTADTFLYSGRLAEGEKELSAQLERFPNDDSVRFGLGSIQFVRAVEHLSQSLYHYGLGRTPFANSVPFLRMPIPANPNCEPIDYPAQRRIFQRFLTDLAKVEATLSKVSDGDFKVPIELTKVQFDPTGEGKSVPITGLLDVYFAANRRQGAQFTITFDAGDAHWLRGYCHLLSALCEVVLAHDFHEIFDHTAHLFFPKAKTPFPFLARTGEQTQPYDWESIVDAITVIHLFHLPVVEKDRMKLARVHLKGMIAESRAMWKCVLAETDDDHEWIPNPRQMGVTGTKVTDEMVKGWMTFLDEADALLDGRKLVPFWRGTGTKGVNLRRVFEGPQTFDLVLWVQGTAAAPYLEEGPLTTKETWTRLQRVFGGDFIGFAIWFN